MRAERLCLAIIFILLLSGALPVSGQGAHTLQGRVISPGGSQPNNSVKVTLKFNGKNIYESFTDLSGRFSFSGLSAGTYELVAEPAGLNSSTMPIGQPVTVKTSV